LIHFDLDDRYQDELVVGSAITKRDGVVVSTLFHALILGLILFGPEWTFFKPDPAEVEARQQELLRQQQERERAARRFVFVQPRVDFEAKQPPPRAELSDINRKAQTPQRAPTPSNPLPFSRGETTERLPLGVNDVPGALARFRVGNKCLHSGEKPHEWSRGRQG